MQGQTKCKIYAQGIECDITRHPVLEPAFLYGGFPPKDLRHKFLMAQESDAKELTPGVLPEGFGDDRLVTVPLTGQHDMRLGYIKLRSVPLSESGREFVDILRQILRELEG